MLQCLSLRGLLDGQPTQHSTQRQLGARALSSTVQDMHHSQTFTAADTSQPTEPCWAGHIVYHGPVGSVLDFFGSLGFRCPERKGVADFMQEVVSRNDQQVCI